MIKGLIWGNMYSVAPHVWEPACLLHSDICETLPGVTGLISHEFSAPLLSYHMLVARSASRKKSKEVEEKVGSGMFRSSQPRRTTQERHYDDGKGNCRLLIERSCAISVVAEAVDGR